MNAKVIFLIPVAASLVCGSAQAAAKPTTEELQAQIQKLEERINQLEAEKAAPPAHASRAYPSPTPNNYPSRPTPFDDPFAWDPFAEMERMNQQMQQMFQGPSSSPAGSHMFSQTFSMGQNFELKDTDQGYVMTIDMKGMDQDKFHLDIKPDYITISGEQSNVNKTQQGQGYFEASSFGSFVQTIPLPADADTSKIKTEKQGDTMVVTIPKKK